MVSQSGRTGPCRSRKCIEGDAEFISSNERNGMDSALFLKGVCRNGLLGWGALCVICAMPLGMEGSTHSDDEFRLNFFRGMKTSDRDRKTSDFLSDNIVIGEIVINQYLAKCRYGRFLPVSLEEFTFA